MELYGIFRKSNGIVTSLMAGIEITHSWPIKEGKMQLVEISYLENQKPSVKIIVPTATGITETGIETTLESVEFTLDFLQVIVLKRLLCNWMENARPGR